jgi:uroporphyrinogen-III synthase
MIEFQVTADHIDYAGCDLLMFTSKQAVVTAEAIDPAWKKFPSIAIGSATRAQIEALGGEVIFSPSNFYALQLSEDIILFFADRSILYLRPEEVSYDSKGALADAGITLHEQIIYKTNCVSYPTDHQPPDSSVIIFTSPSTIRCFLQNFSWLPSYTAVVIGNATKIHLPDGAQYAVAEQPLISECIKTAKEIAKQSRF